MDTAQPWQPPGLTVREQHGAHARVVIEVSGELDFAAVGRLRSRLLPATEHGTVVLDMAGVSFCDSGGIRVLVEAERSARGSGGAFRIAAPSDAVRRVLDLTNLDQMLEIFPDVDSALNR
jgi:anti-anti-sigma factor